MRQTSSLHSFVHGTLVYRLIVLGLTLAIIIGLTVLFSERDRISQEVIDVIVNEISVFVDRYDSLLTNPDAMEPEKLEKEIRKFGSTRTNGKLGSFVYVAVYDAHGKIITELFDGQSNHSGRMQEKLVELNAKKPIDSTDQYEVVLVSGLPLLRIALPIVNKGQKIIGSINAFFAFSHGTIHASRMRGLRAVFSAIFIVLLTTAMLYPVVLRLTKRISEFSEQLLKANIDTLETLGSAIALRDSDTNGHNYRVSIYASRLGEEIGLPDQTMRTLIKGSFLHDVGKIGIPDEILLKAGKLSDKERAIMKTHVELGHAIIQRSRWLSDAREIVLFHHERLMGQGYPRGVSGNDIPIAARIFTIADVFDALTSKRPYKEAWSFEQAMETMNNGKGSHFDPVLLDAFNRIARSLYDTFGEKEEIIKNELGEIIKKYFYRSRGGLEY
jgi:hypothetical protein